MSLATSPTGATSGAAGMSQSVTWLARPATITLFGTATWMLRHLWSNV
jgi:hypothetical protein